MNGVVTDIILVIGFIKNTIDRIKGFDEALGETTKYMTTLQITIQNVANENRMSGFDDVLNEVTNTLNDLKDDIVYVNEKRFLVRFLYTKKYQDKFQSHIKSIKNHLTTLNVFIANKTVEIHNDVKKVANNVETVMTDIQNVDTDVKVVDKNVRQLKREQSSKLRYLQKELTEMKKMMEENIASSLTKMGEQKQELDIHQVSKALDESQIQHSR